MSTREFLNHIINSEMTCSNSNNFTKYPIRLSSNCQSDVAAACSTKKFNTTTTQRMISCRTSATWIHFWLSIILCLLFAPSTLAFSEEIFERHALNKHKAFAQGAATWIANSEDECLYRFEYERWPCDQDEHREIVSGNSSILGTKEAAFVQALTAASVIQTSLKLCFDGTKDIDCECKDADQRDRYTVSVESGDETNTIVTCSEEYIQFATRVFGKFRKSWLTGRESAHDLMIMHNSETGRRMLIKRKYEKCSCHGMSGSCSIKTCWEELPQIRHVSAVLKSIYNNERSHVKTLLHEGLRKKLLTIDSRMVPSKNALVYVDDSPDYCEYMHERNCSKSIPMHYEQENVPEYEKEHRAKLVKSCDNLCTECGYKIWERQIKIQNTECECVFHWCCHVNCTVCMVDQTLHSCMSPDPIPRPIRLPSS